MNKKALELSINFLVVVIIAIVMLSLGILLINRYFLEAETIKSEIEEETEKQINILFNQGEIVAIPTKTVERGKDDIAWIGILNVKDSGNFNVKLTFKDAYDKLNNVLNTSQLSPDDWPIFIPDFYLETRTQKNLPMNIAVPKNALKGTYIYHVNVTRERGLYKKSRMYITVS
ncbi:hypothetical protein KY332_05080 [Candidatus Woesearchaeota archaeon]|nr:hypothetical protein [Candidatus Woesearchaeota archaeon]